MPFPGFEKVILARHQLVQRTSAGGVKKHHEKTLKVEHFFGIWVEKTLANALPVDWTFCRFPVSEK